MSKFRADFLVKGSLVLPFGSEPMVISGDDPPFEMLLCNADPDGAGHTPALTVRVMADCDAIENVAGQFRTLLAQQLDVLSFVTHSAFRIDECQRVIDWEPHQKSRRIRPMKKFDPFDPPDPELHRELIETAQAITRAKQEDYVIQAQRSFRYGVIERQPEDQFQHFWLAIETIAEGSKATTRAPIPCPKCQGALFCSDCNESPLRRPMARQAIRQLLSAIREDGGGRFYRDLVRTRDHLLHGRSPDTVEKEVGLPLPVLVDEAGRAAWHAILNSMPKLEGAPVFAHRDGDFVNNVVILTPDMVLEYDGIAPHPSEAQIPKVEMSMQVRFGPAREDKHAGSEPRVKPPI
ncbi:hypothetical protein IVB16_28610 [Bradyrhizobium sp. 183]|uniref:hypothetical protein n=1 Tax=unclassified Bradyrhizobium TaxID=2631580 RepID=UPI001FFF7DAC|nr:MULTISPECIES: hypothetical protein [unclassified Bradyrhizobium]UPJ78801.1 hypothetical protein IVB17_28615 [Bradyrhizobium sp. 184]UPJ86594.1 hypothetical protein IVB16_28610 [Bradyrhizobium sp. 183]